MSFTASAARARDAGRPLGLRVACLHGCLERFSLFGFTTTRAKLREHVGAEGAHGWTEAQLVAALDLLEEARASWVAYAGERLPLLRQAKREDRNAHRPGRWDLFRVWLEEFLDGGHAADWGVEGLGLCDACGHRLVHHGGRACRVCLADRSVPWDEACLARMPSS